MTTANTTELYRKFRASGYAPKFALSAARTLQEWESLDSGLVRVRADDEQEDYFSVYGEPEGYETIHGRRVSAEDERKEICDAIDHDGIWCVFSEWFDGESWRCADSVGMCYGYRNPCSPFQNCYVIDLMRSALDALQASAIAPAL